MEYAQHINELLRVKTPAQPLVLDLFAGCGGLALGFEAQGFQTLGYEMDAHCCATYRHNLHGDCIQAQLDAHFEFPPADVVIGGPPCQPFSVGGEQKGVRDARDGFPAFIAAIEQVRPALWLFENVRGLMYRNRHYLDAIITELENLGYTVEFKLLNAVAFDVPQNRERLIVVGHKGSFKFPQENAYKVSAGTALSYLAFQHEPASKFLTPNMDAYVAKYEKASKCITPRDLHLDRPARTVTCRNLGGATGDMHRVVLPDGRRRRLTVREGARLQSFPDWYAFLGPEASQYNQIGNAVPPMLAYHLAASVRDYLDHGRHVAPPARRLRHHAVQLELGMG